MYVYGAYLRHTFDGVYYKLRYNYERHVTLFTYVLEDFILFRIRYAA